MYLSLLKLNPNNRQVWRDVSDCHELHRTILRAFPQVVGHDPRAQLRVLHRLEMSPNLHGIALYVQSSAKPDWSVLGSSYLTPNQELLCKSIENHLQAIRQGTVLRFRLRANPTKKIGTSTKAERLQGLRRNGQRVPLLNDSEQLQWLERKGHTLGFSILDVEARVPSVQLIQTPKQTGHKDGRDLTFQGVLFEGVLRVTEREVFLGAIHNGVGSGKAYGFGLLSVAP